MIIIPAIDLIGGKCVRLVQGDYNKETVYSDNPVEMAKKWKDKGAEFLHVVDLDGAAKGEPVNIKVIGNIVKNVPNINVQVGGGIRTNDTVKRLLEIGVNRVIIGTKAVKTPEWIEELCNMFNGKIAVAVDVKNGNVATEGWLQTEAKSAINFAKELIKYKLSALIVTDINKDGMLKGPNLTLMEELKNVIKEIPLIASGGVTSIPDIEALKKIDVDGAIIGKALYDNKIELEKAIKHARE
ncbi:MAG: 1-(5-phosphoribosyl)-5-[(5-phosphoribosylamino)methylideneamino]imidazole-4-carboxamide isomerase [Candidatus Anammoxibacter sp.]